MFNRFKLVVIVILALLIGGCASNYYNIPRETYEKQVRVLGIAPIMIDADSDIQHPQKDEILNIVRDANRKNEKALVDTIKDTGEYFTVRLLDNEAGQLFSDIFLRREPRNDAGIVYNKYFFNPEKIKELVTSNNLDAVMLVVVSGASIPDKLYSSNLMSTLKTKYNALIMTAQIIDANNNVLWEYPNFRQRSISFDPLVLLQYPDFDEAKANKTDRVEVKFKTVEGIRRAFSETDSSLFKTRTTSAIYMKQFGEMKSLLSYFHNPFSSKKDENYPTPGQSGQ
ncbi:MAG: hypothetical protein FWD70_07000 [Desulfuromonadales bacterium]|nr:hypothetical protein [Desulfuromonadales bacterium]